jgi:hypothetical protein
MVHEPKLTSHHDKANAKQVVAAFVEQVKLPRLDGVSSVDEILDSIGLMTDYGEKDPVALSEWVVKLTFYNLFLNKNRVELLRTIRFLQNELDSVVGQNLASNPEMRSLYGKTAERIVCAEDPRAMDIQVRINQYQLQLDTLEGWNENLTKLAKSIESLVYAKKQAKYTH